MWHLILFVASILLLDYNWRNMSEQMELTSIFILTYVIVENKCENCAGECQHSFRPGKKQQPPRHPSREKQNHKTYRNRHYEARLP